MFEHVGVFHYRAFFDTVSPFLKPDGVALCTAWANGMARGSQSLD